MKLKYIYIHVFHYCASITFYREILLFTLIISSSIVYFCFFDFPSILAFRVPKVKAFEEFFDS